MKVFESHKLHSKIEINGMDHFHIRTEVYRASQLGTLDATPNRKYMRGVSFQLQHANLINLSLSIFPVSDPSPYHTSLSPAMLNLHVKIFGSFSFHLG